MFSGNFGGFLQKSSSGGGGTTTLGTQTYGTFALFKTATLAFTMPTIAFILADETNSGNPSTYIYDNSNGIIYYLSTVPTNQ